MTLSHLLFVLVLSQRIKQAPTEEIVFPSAETLGTCAMQCRHSTALMHCCLRFLGWQAGRLKGRLGLLKDMNAFFTYHVHLRIPWTSMTKCELVPGVPPSGFTIYVLSWNDLKKMSVDLLLCQQFGPRLVFLG